MPRFVSRFGCHLRRVGAILIWCFYAIPTYACVANPLIGMISPVGVEWLLLSSWSPFYWFYETRWLVFKKVSMPTVFSIDLNPVIGWSLLALGLGVFLVSTVQFFSSHNVGLVTCGVYSKIRHPQYLGIIVATFGFTVASERPMSWMAWLTVTSMYIALAVREEQILEDRHEIDFQNYRDTVPFILPGVTPMISQRIRVPRTLLHKDLLILLIYCITIVVAWFTLKYVSYAPSPFL